MTEKASNTTLVSTTDTLMADLKRRFQEVYNLNPDKLPRATFLNLCLTAWAEQAKPLNLTGSAR